MQIESSSSLFDAQELFDSETQRTRLYLNHDDLDNLFGQDHVLSGSALSCVFWGPYFHMDDVKLGSLLKNLDFTSDTLKTWIEEKAASEGYSKISFDVLYGSFNSDNLEFIKQSLASIGLKRKAFIYQISVANAWDKIDSYISNLPSDEIRYDKFENQIFLLTLEDIQENTPRFSQLSNLYCAFNKTMYVPSLFRLSTTKALENDGGIILFQSHESNKIEAMVSYGKFVDKNGQKSMLIDSLFVSENHRGKKISPILIHSLLQQAKEKNFTQIYWETGLGRAQAQQLYQNKFGIEPYGFAFRYATPPLIMIKSHGWHVAGNLLYRGADLLYKIISYPVKLFEAKPHA